VKGENMLLMKVNTRDAEDVRKALISLCDIDEDMNGNNGEEYLWDVAKTAGFESNAEYLADLVMTDEKLATARDKFEAFAREFFISNDNYYEGYELEFLEDGDDLVVAFHMWER
jgi:hypothetical protein